MIIPITQAASILGLSPQTLRCQARFGRFRAVKVGREWLVDEAEVERYRLENKGRAGRRAPKRSQYE